MSQTTIPASLTVAIKGALADASDYHAESFVSEETVTEVPFGIFVIQGVADRGAKLPGASTDVVVGAALHHHAIAPAFGSTGDLGTTGYKPKAPISLLRSGRFYTVSETDVVAGDRVFVRYAAGAGGTQLGAVRNATVANEMLDLTKCAVFRTSGVAGTLVEVEINMTIKP